MFRELGVANRRRPHVDAAAAGAEIERGADQSHVPLPGCALTAARLTSRPWWASRKGEPRRRFASSLADDDGSFLESLRPLIEHQPELTVVGTAANGLDAIELADELEPDAVVIDLHMPLVDGVTAVARLRKDHPSLCLIALTGDPDRQLHSRSPRRAPTRCCRRRISSTRSSSASRPFARLRARLAPPAAR